MYLFDIRSKEYFLLEDNQIEYLKILLSKLDIANVFSNFMMSEMDSFDCESLAILIQNHLNQNKIFESLDGEKPVPVIVDNNTQTPDSYKPLPLSRISFLSNLVRFLFFAKMGISIS